MIKPGEDLFLVQLLEQALSIAIRHVTNLESAVTDDDVYANKAREMYSTTDSYY